MSNENLPPEKQPTSNNPYNTPTAETVRPIDPNQEGDATGGVIPYKNPCALIAYYLGIFSLLPIIGVPFGLASFVLGIIGLKKRKSNPAIKGSAHAWIGIVCGFLSMLCGGGLVAIMILGSLQ